MLEHGGNLYLASQKYNLKQQDWLEQLAQQGIFTRLFTAPLSLRFGLPNSEQEWQRLTQALEKISLP